MGGNEQRVKEQFLRCGDGGAQMFNLLPASSCLPLSKAKLSYAERNRFKTSFALISLKEEPTSKKGVLFFKRERKKTHTRTRSAISRRITYSKNWGEELLLSDIQDPSTVQSGCQNLNSDDKCPESEQNNHSVLFFIGFPNRLCNKCG